jgi:peptidoglycan/xylan/chitin deacetylase (PgdA/CDA1 family)
VVEAPPEPTPTFTPEWDLPGGPIYGLPTGAGNKIAWTVDDGASPEVVQAYAEFARDTGTRLTFFINGMYPSWEQSLPTLAPLVASGQVQIANHTFSHAGLTQLSDAQIQDELMVNHEHIQRLFGVDARPWYRPPFGWRDERTDAAAAAVGYTVPTMWYGSLGDSGLIDSWVLLGEAEKWLNAETIILGHANAPTVMSLFPQLTGILEGRGLQTVTLNDVFRV